MKKQRVNLPSKQLKVFKKFRLKKKWRFWRNFKRFFLGQKKRKLFSKLKWMFAQKKIIWHQLASFYGKNVKKLMYSKNQVKLAFGTRFFNVLPLLELRLNIFILRARFASKLLEANTLINSGKILVNTLPKQKRYVVRIGDTVQYLSTQNRLTTNTRWASIKRFIKSNKRKPRKSVIRRKRGRFTRKNKRFFQKRLQAERKIRQLWRKRKKTYRKRCRWHNKQNLVMNYVEIKSAISAAILLRKPVIGEILLSKRKRMLTTKLLKRVYFLY
jgi:ribosomal protein S4